ncbi:MAG: phosphate ABC transporter substrate-binding protein [Flavobacterium psychrophilum]|nr:MAG: phosphate ABC transporter substrate-binding protein [Flavobacterium psychrophilum]
MAKQVISSIIMKHTYKIFVSLFIITLVFSCKDDKTTRTKEIEETLTSGNTTILVDNTVQPAVEDVLQVFHSVYPRAHVTQVNKSDTEVVKDLVENKASVVVMPRLLTEEENAYFVKRKITPQITQFASDAIAFIANKSAKDTVVELNEILKVIKGEPSDKVQKLVFDNANSGAVGELLKRAGVKQLPAQNVYSLKTNEEVIRYVHDNPGSVGVVGVNWLSQPSQEMRKIVSDITVLAVDNVKIDKGVKKYYKPTQSNIATDSYPLIRKVYVLNYSGRDGLGMGFATYIGAFEGQRIILKTGLLPVKLPYREIEVTE